MSISMFKFLSGYYGVNLDAGSECTHNMIKKDFTFLKSCSFKHANDNPELVSNGKIIYVTDSHNRTIPYICPDKIKTSTDECTYTDTKEEDNTFDDKSILDELEDLPTYLVHELLSKYKDKPSFYRIIKKELIKRGIYKTKQYKLKKEIKELEESEYNDKYQRRREIKRKKS